MSVPVAAASAAAAARLVASASGPCVSLTVGSDGSKGVTPVAPGVAAAMEDVLRALRGDVRVVVLKGLHHLPGLPSLPEPVRTAAAAERTWPAEQSTAPVGEGVSLLGPTALGGDTTSGGDIARWRRLTRRLSERPDLLSVAVLTGPVTGVGLALALACDFRVMAENSSLCLTDAAYGRVPALGVAGILVDTLGYGRALQLCLTGESVGAREAGRTGLAAVVTPTGRLDAEVDRLVRNLLAIPREAAAETKALLAGAREQGPARRHDAEREALERLLTAAAEDVG